MNKPFSIFRSGAKPRVSRFTLHAPRSTLHAPRSTLHAPRPSSRAFTLIEILVAVALLAFIVLGLFAMFGQVQRAFRSSMNQVDQLEAGRAVAEMLPDELEQMTPSDANAVGFYTQIIPTSTPLTQSLPGTTLLRTNLLEDCFFLLRQNQTWVGIGYCVRTNDSTGRLWLPETGPGSGQLGVGTLYRWSASTNVLRSDSPYQGLPSDPSQLFVAFQNAALAGSTLISNRICDGVVHFYLQAFATNGFPIVFGTSFGTNAACFLAYTNALAPFATSYGTLHPAQVVGNGSYPGSLARLALWSNAVPASVELQLGILEQHAADRYNSIGAAAARLLYLQRPDTASRVNLFRRRITIRNVDPLAYQ